MAVAKVAPRPFQARLVMARHDVVIRRVEDLDAWQVADELKREVYALVATGSGRSDFKFRDQLRDAASSATRNIREGFGRFYPRDFARFMDYAIASLMEVQECLKDGADRGHFTEQGIQRGLRLCGRSLQVSKGLKRYLLSCRRHPFRPAPPERGAKPPERSPKPPERGAKPPEPSS